MGVVSNDAQAQAQVDKPSTTTATSAAAATRKTSSATSKNVLPAKATESLTEAKREAAALLFEQAQIEFDQGKYADAANKYYKLHTITKHPSVLFNLAKALEMSGSLENAITDYETFLETASEEEAKKLRQHVAKLKSTPAISSMAFKTDFGKPPLVFVDGKISFLEKGTVSLVPGVHVFDAISQVSYRHEVYTFSPGRKLSVTPPTNERDGNVVLSGSSEASRNFHIKGLLKNSFGQRFEQPPGEYELTVEAKNSKLCQVKLTVPILAEGVTLIFVNAEPIQAMDANGKRKTYAQVTAKECGNISISAQPVPFGKDLPAIPYVQYPKDGIVAPKAGSVSVESKW
jgi:tetratricopeptide (TPR) repeat protein